MRSKSTLFTLLLCSMSSWFLSGYAQDAAVVKPGAYSAGQVTNFVRTWDAVVPETDAANITSATAIDRFRMTTQYVDGLGRPLQTVVKQGGQATGGAAADLVSPVLYDELGREVRKYLPFVANATGTNTSVSDGQFKTNPFDQQQFFYSDANAASSPVKGQGETFYYSKSEMEASPLNRVLRTYAPGDSWVNQGRGSTMQYLTNTALDAVRNWQVTDNSTVGSFGSYTTASTYAAGELYKTITEDEHQRQVTEFKDKDGKVILRKVQLTASKDTGTGSGHAGWLCTYYLYDDLGRLRGVIQPKAVETFAATNTWSLTPTQLEELCFRYEYDERSRLIVKKVPGAGAVSMVYDKKNRLVMSQDANQASGSKKWFVTLYDELDRPLMTGLWTNASDRAFHAAQAMAGSTAVYPFSTSATPSTATWELLSETHYDNYQNLPTGLSSTLQGQGSFISAANFVTVYNASPLYAQPLTSSQAVRGMVTWAKVKELGTASKFISSVNIYDEKGRLIQVQTVNTTGGVDIATTQYDFSGKILRMHLRLQLQGATVQTHEIATQLSYDAQGRLAQVQKKVNNAAWRKISELEYDALGQLKTKKLGTNPGTTSEPLETLTYDYNIRGWLLGVNREYAKKTGTTPDKYFGFDLGYDKADIKPLAATSIGSYSHSAYNGNIAGMVWKSTGDDQVRKYDFTYDGVNRLAGADFTQHSGSFNKTAGIDYSVSGLTYDANGNITAMTQRGWKLGGSGAIDALSYSYLAGGNKLQGVVDGSNDHSSKLGDFKYNATAKTTTDYSYDANGNLVKDLNKSIGSSGANGIVYNYLNLPQVITVLNPDGTAKGTITYTYDAAGTKLRKVVQEQGLPAKTTLYLAGVVYEDNVLQFIGHEEGRIRYRPADGSTAATFQYDYFLKDHLGNVRMVLTEEELLTPYETLTFEDYRLAEQNSQWENSQGQSINVAAVRTDVNFGGTFTKAMLLSKWNGAVGATKLLKVMAGDRIHAKLDYYYYYTPTADNNDASPVTSILSSLVSSLSSTGVSGGLLQGGEAAIGSQLQNSAAFTGFVSAAPSTNPNNTSQQAPMAYLYVLFFDEQFQFDQASSRIVKVDYLTSNVRKTIDRTFSNAIAAGKNGYAYVYFANESNESVYFDNFNLSHERGRVLEETHYYPFGLQMAGISSRAAGALENRFQYNGKERQTELGLEWMDYGARMYDAQLGRWHVVDPMASAAPDWSPYRAFYDNPIFWTDPTGMLEFESYAAYKTYADENGLEVLSRSKMGTQGHWLTRHRQENTQVWNAANKHNLQQKEGYNQYTTIAQRASFYEWFQGATESQGQETVWAGAAAIIAGQMAQTESFEARFFVSDEVIAFAKQGNKKIFDDAFGRLRSLYNNGQIGNKLTGDAANQWDAQTLYREQFLTIDPLYRSQSVGTINELSKIAKGESIFGIATMFTPELKFKGNLSNPQDRYNHGMNVVVPFYKKWGFSGGPGSAIRFRAY